MMFLCSKLIYKIKPQYNFLSILWSTSDIIEYRYYHKDKNLIDRSYFGPSILIIGDNEYK